MPPDLFSHHNESEFTPKEIFTEAHSDLVKRGGKWLNSTSTSCSLVSTLIATIAFATSATVPGSFNVSENLFNLTENFKVQIKNLTAKGLNVQKIDIQIC